MGMRQIWDGEGLPPLGVGVLIRLNRSAEWVEHEVTGIQVLKDSSQNSKFYFCWRINVDVKHADGSSNQRALDDCQPLTWREPKT